MKLLVLRHAKTDENIAAGWTPQPLLPEGVEHAKIILNTFLNKYPELKIKHIVSSDLMRCAQTAEIMAKELNVPLTLDEGFRGFNIGSGAGVTQSEFFKAHPLQFIKYLAPDESIDGGESPNQFYHRVAEAFDNLVKNANDKEDMILVTHRSVLEVIYSIASNIQWSNRINYYEMEYLLLDLKKEKNEEKKNKKAPISTNLHRSGNFVQS